MLTWPDADVGSTTHATQPLARLGGRSGAAVPLDRSISRGGSVTLIHLTPRRRCASDLHTPRLIRRPTFGVQGLLSRSETPDIDPALSSGVAGRLQTADAG
jgi:hypothetical protein